MLSPKICTPSKEDEMTTTEEEEDKVGEVIKSKSVLRSSMTHARPEATIRPTVGILSRTTTKATARTRDYLVLLHRGRSH